VVDPGAWEVRWAAIEELAGLLHEEHELMTTVTTDEQAEAAYATDVLAVGDQLGISGNDTWGVLSDAVEHVTDSRKNQAAVKALRESLDKATRKREGLTLALAGHEAVIARLQADDDLEEVVARSREVARERERESTSLDQIRLAARTKTDLEGLVTRLAGLDAIDLAAKEIEAKTTLDERSMPVMRPAMPWPRHRGRCVRPNASATRRPCTPARLRPQKYWPRTSRSTFRPG
jgi:hypothetical protein